MKLVWYDRKGFLGWHFPCGESADPATRQPKSNYLILHTLTHLKHTPHTTHHKHNHNLHA